MFTKILSLILICVNFKLFESTAVHTDCGSQAEVLDVIVNTCQETDKQCILKKNTNVSIEIKFQSPEPISTVKAIVHGHFMGITEEFRLPNNDGCYKSGLVCPLAEDTPYTYEISLPILPKYPSLHGIVKWELQDENSQDIVCLQVPAKISS